MAKKNKLLRLKGTPGKRREKHVGTSVYIADKNRIVKQANARGMTVSYYITYLSYQDWMTPTEQEEFESYGKGQR